MLLIFVQRHRNSMIPKHSPHVEVPLLLCMSTPELLFYTSNQSPMTHDLSGIIEASWEYVSFPLTAFLTLLIPPAMSGSACVDAASHLGNFTEDHMCIFRPGQIPFLYPCNASIHVFNDCVSLEEDRLQNGSGPLLTYLSDSRAGSCRSLVQVPVIITCNWGAKSSSF